MFQAECGKGNAEAILKSPGMPRPLFRQWPPPAFADYPRPSDESQITLSFVIPVFNSAATLPRVAADIFQLCAEENIEIILINDGSSDQSEEVCRALVREHPGRVCLIQLSRNYGEHNAVMAGLRQARGGYAAIIDDDGQHAPADALRMLAHASAHQLDVVYGRFGQRRHSMFRVAGSRLTNWMADRCLKKPRGVYLSSFKVLHRFVIDQICRHSGPNPYVDGLIFRVTDRIGQIQVEHRIRERGRSGYTIGKLAALWLSIFAEYSLLPVRLALLAGAAITVSGALATGMLLGLRISGTWAGNPEAWIGALVVTCLGFELLLAGFIGEYVNRMLLHQSGMPQHVLRYVRRNEADDEDRGFAEASHRKFILAAE